MMLRIQTLRTYFQALNKDERGFTLLEYCAGAAVILVIIWVALEALGGNMQELLEAIGEWATTRADDITELDAANN